MARRAKSGRQQRRGRPKYEPRDRALIVCEGTKTEKRYFEDARRVLGVHQGQAVVEVESGDGTNPRNIVDTARRLRDQAKKEGNAFSVVYCVFDRDEHAHYAASIERAKWLAMRSITSVPCFEYWVLLHFRNHGAPYARSGGRSPCDCCRDDLLAEWPDYTKNRKRLYTELKPRLDDARRRAEQRLQAVTREGSNNPCTEVHRVLDAMAALKETRMVRP